MKTKQIITANHHMLLNQFIKEEVEFNLLYEGLIVSHPINDVKNQLLKSGFKEDQVDIIENQNGTKVVFLFFYIDENKNKRYENLIQLMENKLGWIHSATLDYDKRLQKDKKEFLIYAKGFFYLQFEAKFDVELSERERPQYLYHITPLRKLNKIRYIGLVPKTRTKLFNYNDRIYFSNTIEALLPIVPTLYQAMVKPANPTRDDNTFIILRINNEIRRLFKDPNFEDGVYSLENVHPTNLIPVARIIVNNSGNIIINERVRVDERGNIIVA